METETNTLILKKKSLKHLNRINRRVPVNIEFSDLKYSVKDPNFKDGKRQILHSINGNFHCGKVTAILGPSGAGKTTLLNILAGYVKSQVQGNINVNGLSRDTANFHKISSYIMQDTILQDYFTTKEALMYAAEFKLGDDVSYKDKVAVVNEVIEYLGLEKCVDTYSEYLSGGERKRLSIGLELVNNPTIIFLDEPTTGLDEFTVKQCMDFLSKISRNNRTVVCTVHQPSVSVFQNFDQVYIIADGYCIYNGLSSQLVPFITHADYCCPTNYTPADYIMELVHSHSSAINDFKTIIQNGKVCLTGSVEIDQNLHRNSEEVSCEEGDVKQNSTDFPTTFKVQFYLLLKRMLLQKTRNKQSLFIQLIHHLCVGLLIGGTFVGIGNNASKVMNIALFCICCTFFYLFTYTMGPVLLFPSEIRLLKREHFNHWYSLKAYYTALTFAFIPFLIIWSTMFSTIVYFMTDQPRETYRFLGFCLVGFFTGMVSQSLGYMVGSVFNPTNGSIVGPSLLASSIIIACHTTSGTGTIETPFKILMAFSYSRYTLIGYGNVMVYNRKPLICPDEEVYCHFKYPALFMKQMGIPFDDYKYQLCYISIFILTFQSMGYLFLKCRLNVELSLKLSYYVKKILNVLNIYKF